MLGRPTCKGSANAGGAPLIARSLLPLIVLMGIANDRPAGLQGSNGVWVTWLHLEPKRPHAVGSSQATRSFRQGPRPEEHTCELPSIMRYSYAVLCLTQNKQTHILSRLQYTIHPLSTHRL